MFKNIKKRLRDLTIGKIFGSQEGYELFLGGKSVSGINVDHTNAMKCVAFFAGVNLISESIGSLPLFVFKRTKDNGKEKATNHPLYNILHSRVNDLTSSFKFRETLQGHLLTWGNGYAHILRNGRGQPVELWIMQPDRVQLKFIDNDLFYQWKDGSNQTTLINKEDIIHIAGLSFDGILGYDRVEQGKESIGTAIAAEEYSNSFFANNAAPSGFLKHPTTIKDSASVKKIMEDWETIYRGNRNAHKVALLQEGMDYKQISINPEVAQLLETKKFSVIDIARLLNIPPHMLRSLDGATFSNIVEQSLNFVIYTLRPWLVRWEQELNYKLFSKTERNNYFVEFSVEGLLRGDPVKRDQSLQIQFNSGVITRNEWRSLLNRNPIQGGDKILLTPPGTAPNQVQTKSLNKEAIHTRDSKLVTDRNKIIKSTKKLYKSAIEKVIKKEINVIRRLNKKYISNNDIIKFKSEIGDFYQKHYKFVFDNLININEHVAEIMNREVGKEVKQEKEVGDNVQSFVEKYTEARSFRHISSSQGQILKIVDDAKTNDDLEKDIINRLNEWDETRSDKFARNESQRSNNAILLATYGFYKVEKIKWVTVGKNCPLCDELNGKVVGVNKTFLQKGDTVVGDETVNNLTTNIDILSPPLHKGCDCSIISL